MSEVNCHPKRSTVNRNLLVNCPHTLMSNATAYTVDQDQQPPRDFTSTSSILMLLARHRYDYRVQGQAEQGVVRARRPAARHAGRLYY